MITIYCALYAEAQYLIQYFELKKDSKVTLFQMFSNEKKDIRVVITGVGKINMVVAIAELSTLYPLKGEDVIIIMEVVRRRIVRWEVYLCATRL